MAKNFLSKYVTYVKLPDYIADFLRTRYGGQILAFAELSPYYNIMRNKLTQQTDMSKPISKQAFSQRVVEYARKCKNRPSLVSDIYVPDQETMEGLQPVYMPVSIIRGNRIYDPDDSWQLNRDGTKLFRNEAKIEFWNTLFQYIEKNRYPKDEDGRLILGKHRELVELIETFINEYDINIDCLENLYRNLMRNKKKMYSTYVDDDYEEQ